MKKLLLITLSLSYLLYSCANDTGQKDGAGADSAGQQANLNDTTRNNSDTAMLDAPVFSIIIDTSDKQLRVIKGTDTAKNYPISVGTAKYPTPIGSFRIYQIDFNPNWTPPEGDWAKNKKPEKPGSKKNPMGKARIVYQIGIPGQRKMYWTARAAVRQRIARTDPFQRETRIDSPASLS